MKKFKIKGVEIFANSLHDALEIYKHKVKDSKVWIEVPDEPDARDDYQWDVKAAKKMASKYGVRLVLKGKVSAGPNKGDNEAYFEGPKDKIKKIAKKIFFDYDDEELEEVIEDSIMTDSKVKDFSPNQLQYCLDEMELAIDDIQKLSRKITSYKNRYFELIKEAKSLASTDKEKQVQVAFWEKQFARAQSAYRASEGAL